MTDWLKTMGEMVVVTLLITAVLVIVPKVWGASRTAPTPEPVRVLSNEEIMIAPLHTTSDLPKRDGGKATNLSTRSHEELVARMDGIADQLAAFNQHVFADEQRLKQIEMRATQTQSALVQLHSKMGELIIEMRKARP